MDLLKKKIRIRSKTRLTKQDWFSIDKTLAFNLFTTIVPKK